VILGTSANPAEYQAYLEQFPKGRFASLARARINSLKVAAAKPAAAVVPPPAPPAPAPAAAPAPAQTQVASVAPTPVASGRGPRIGDRYTYQYTDLWKPGLKVDVIHTVAELREHEIIETLSAAIDGRTYVENAAAAKGAEMREWKLGDITLREFAPFALALDVVRPGEAINFTAAVLEESRSDWGVRGTVSEEAVTVPAGRFRATKVLLEGKKLAAVSVLGASPLSRVHSFQLSVWYAPESRRYVKAVFVSYSASPAASNSVYHNELYELVSAPAR